MLMSGGLKWSFSGLKDYVNCPKQYHEVKVLKNYTKSMTEQMRYGTEVHKALEDYAALNKPLPKNYQRFKELMDALAEIPGEHFNEHKMALDKSKTPCGFDAAEYWVRGIADRLVVDGDQGYVIDYKTGSNRYPDTKQLQLMALLMFAHFPELNYVKGGLLFVMHDGFVNSEYKREDMVKLWGQFDGNLQRLEDSFLRDSWPCNPTPLCGWCPVDQCQYHKQRR
jgi:hypothetical protein